MRVKDVLEDGDFPVTLLAYIRAWHFKPQIVFAETRHIITTRMEFLEFHGKVCYQCVVLKELTLSVSTMENHSQ